MQMNPMKASTCKNTIVKSENCGGFFDIFTFRKKLIYPNDQKQLTSWTIFKIPGTVFIYEGSNLILVCTDVLDVTVVVVVCCPGKPASTIFH